MASIIVSGYMLRYPLAGTVSTYLQYLLGLRLLGHDVLYVEGRDWESTCEQTRAALAGEFPCAGLTQARELLRRRRADIPIVWVDEQAGLVEGMIWPQLRARVARADLVLDIGGVCELRERERAGARALVDIDPLVTQARGVRRHDYDAHFSYAVNIGRAGCGLHTNGRRWLPTVPPVVPQLWRARRPRASSPLTALAARSRRRASSEGCERERAPSTEFDDLLDLPKRVSSTLELALPSTSPRLRERFARAGWAVRDASQVTALLSSYHSYIVHSQAGIGGADGEHVATASGWVGGRSVSCLAAGRPAIVQDTGLEDWLQTGAGVLTFSTAEEAAACVERVGRELARQSQAAHAVASTVFHYRAVLRQLLEHALPPGARRGAGGGPAMAGSRRTS